MEPIILLFNLRFQCRSSFNGNATVGQHDRSFALAEVAELAPEISRCILGECPTSEPDCQAEALTLARNVADPPQIDFKSVVGYRRETEKAMASRHPADQKRLIRTWVQEVKLEPQTLRVEISYSLAEAVMKGLVAGAGFEPATFGL